MTFNARAIDLYKEWGRDKLNFLRAYFYISGMTKVDLEDVTYIYSAFYKKNYEDNFEAYACCCAELNENYVTPLQFWYWYDSSTRIRNQIQREAKRGEYHE